MTAALSIAAQGFPVHLVEREQELGGNLRHIHIGMDGSDPQRLLEETIDRVTGEPRISVLTGSGSRRGGGYVGKYRTTVRRADGEQRRAVAWGNRRRDRRPRAPPESVRVRSPPQRHDAA